MKKKIKLKYSNIALVILIILLVLMIFISIKVLKESFKKEKATEIQIVDTIEKYGYHLTENNTEYVKKLFEELRDILSKNPVDKEEYAKVLTQIFIADFFDLNSKSSKNEVGGAQFIYSEYQNDFVLSAKDANGIYYHVKNNLYGKRKQKLPEVTDVTINSIDTDIFESDMVSGNSYIVDVDITYKEDLGYQDHAVVTLVDQDNKLSVVKLEE